MKRFCLSNGPKYLNLERKKLLSSLSKHVADTHEELVHERGVLSASEETGTGRQQCRLQRDRPRPDPRHQRNADQLQSQKGSRGKIHGAEITGEGQRIRAVNLHEFLNFYSGGVGMGVEGWVRGL